MARELMSWLASGVWRRPWIVVAWLALLSLAWVLPSAARYFLLGGPERNSLYGLEAVFLWFLVGGVLGLAALQEIDLAVTTLRPLARWRVRGTVLLLLQGIPAIPILLPAVVISPPGVGPLVLWIAVLLLAQSALLASVTAALPWAPLRALTFLASAWWIPALAPRSPSTGAGLLAQVALRGIETGNIDNSPLWSGWLGSMLALTCLALALDIALRPTT